MATTRKVTEQLKARGFTNEDIYVDLAIAPIASDMAGKTRNILRAIEILGTDSSLRGIHLMVGLSNHSQGLPPKIKVGFGLRGIIESAFLTLAIPLGLDTVLATPANNYRILPSGNFVKEGYQKVLNQDGVGAVMAIRDIYSPQ